jgi:hypothetical protein
MKKSQLNNLINFCFNFHGSMGVNPFYQSPDYILEKWNKCIGVKTINNKSSVTNEDLLFWKRIWRKEEDWAGCREILDFLYDINSTSCLTPSYMIDSLKKNTGISINQINDVEYKNLHHLVRKSIDEIWLDDTLVKRDYNLNLLMN